MLNKAGIATHDFGARRFALGGTGLLRDFLESCTVAGGGSLFFTAPFYDEPFLVQLARQLTCSTALHILVKHDDAAGKILHLLSHYHRGATTVSICDSLHAKVYMFESSRRRDLTALIGSHNPTTAGLAANLEAGVLIGAVPHTRMWTMLSDLRESLKGNSRRHRHVTAAGPRTRSA